MKILTLVILMLMAINTLRAAIFLSPEEEEKGEIIHTESMITSKNLTITVTYDNNLYREKLENGWGFSCLIRGMEKTILFDTGGNSSILLRNMKKLDIDSGEVVVLSHIHGDHVGGFYGFLEKNSKVVVYLPGSFPESFKDEVKECGAKVVEIRQPLKICENVYSTGELGVWIKEQALIVRTEKGLIVITGCAHPGIVKIVSKAKDLIKDDVLLVMGGFHLGGESRGKIEKIISSFKKLGVQHVGPCHCSGDLARKLFEREYGKNYIDVGVGKVITMEDLK